MGREQILGPSVDGGLMCASDEDRMHRLDPILAFPFGRIMVVGEENFLRECVRNGLQCSFSARVEACDDFDLLPSQQETAIALLVVAASAFTKAGAVETVRMATEAAPDAPVVLFSLGFDSDVARAAVTSGAKGFISMSMGFKAALEAVRFVLAGGTFIPAECFLAGGAVSRDMPAAALASGGMTPKELVVVRAIQQGKPNKIIAHEIGCSETTVKVHLRNVMRKLGARNRTEVAIRVNELLLPPVARAS